MSFRRIEALVALLVLLGIPSAGHAFMKEGCGSGACGDCHKLSREEAAKLLSGAVDNVLDVAQSPVKGLWLVTVSREGQRAPVYIDYSRRFLISGQVFQIDTRSNITGQTKPNAVKVDPSTIPLGDAVVVGSPRAKKRIIVFSDPDCHFCAKLHGEMKTVLARDPDTVFYVKLMSLSRNPETTRKAAAIVCGKSAALLDDAFAGKTLPAPSCTTDAVEENGRLAAELTLMGTPALILPDGRILRGYRDAETILSELAKRPPAPESPPAAGKTRK